MERAELIALLRATGGAEGHGELVFLRDSKWSAAEQARFEMLKLEVGNPPGKITEGWLCIPTGGTSGGMRFARHDERTLTAAVRGFCAHFEIGRVNAVDVLPPYHVSGLMARVRCAATGGEHVPWDWSRLEAGELPALSPRPDGWIISLVPTQLQRLLPVPETLAWLRRFRVILIGGGPIWPELAEAAARAELPLALSYGMTETAAMVAALRPAEFLDGARSCGTALPHARIMLTSEGVVKVAGASVFRGYVFPGMNASPEPRDSTKEVCHVLRDKLAGAGAGEMMGESSEGRDWVTQDLGRIDERGHLHILGRRDAVIITGGKKVQPAEVEAALLGSGEFADVAVIGVPDAEWGQAVVACYLAGGQKPDVERASKILASHQRPKRFVAIADWPRNAQGKVNREALLRLVGVVRDA